MAGLPDNPDDWFRLEDPDEPFGVPLHPHPLHLAGDPYFPHDEDEGDLSEEEPTPLTPPDSPPRPPLPAVPSARQGPLYDEYPRNYYVSPIYHLDPAAQVSRPTSGLLGKRNRSSEPSWLTDLLSRRDATDLPPRFEVGKSSRAPLRFNPEDDPIPRLMTQIDQTEDRIRSLEQFVKGPGSTSLDHRVETLEEEEKENSDAIQILYHLSGADHDAVNALSAQVRAQNYRIQIMESELAAQRNQLVISAQERRYILDQFEDFVLYVMTRFGR
ncbi:unnamed protein product [Lactuca saligna]|uniref:Uncharacterized protein n=1 Tax=Lactuca saligna TaxID=75948 RepID=A0AA36A2D3_LACSI|nr:unnamed protein product [Lactuca saligna]